jgi:hypothetical protein
MGLCYHGFKDYTTVQEALFNREGASRVQQFRIQKQPRTERTKKEEFYRNVKKVE